MPREQQVPNGKPFSTSKSPSSASVASNVVPSNKASKTRQILGSATSTLSKKASKATKWARKAATDATESATNKAKIATASICQFMAEAKIHAKERGEKHASQARQSMSRIGASIKQSAKDSEKKTGEQIKGSIKNASTSTMNRLKDKISQRMPKLPNLPFASANKPPAESSIISAPSSNRISNAMPSEEEILKSASNIATETVARTTNNVATQVQETANKAMRWMWWWGLAVVGAHGVSTTLTKEGVKTLKDTVSSAKEPLTDAHNESDDTSASDAPTISSSTDSIDLDNNFDLITDDANGEKHW